MTQAATGCDEPAVREALDNSGAIPEDLEYDITYLDWAEGFGWALVDPIRLCCPQPLPRATP